MERPSVLGSLLLIFAAGLIGWLWLRGYLTRWLDELAGAVQEAPPLRPVNIPGGPSTSSPAIPIYMPQRT